MSFLYDSCAHTYGKKFYFLCTFVRGEIFHKGDAYTKEKRHCVNKKTFFCLFFLYGCFLVCFMVLWVMFSIYALLFSLHRVCVLDMLTSLCYCASLTTCSDDHCTHFHMIVMYLIKLLICFTTFLLDYFLLVTLYLSFYYLFYFERLMCFVQVFQVIDIYIPSSSQLLWFTCW